MSIRILLVEDDAEIGEFVTQGLREKGLILQLAADAESGGHYMLASKWDVIIRLVGGRSMGLPAGASSSFSDGHFCRSNQKTARFEI